MSDEKLERLQTASKAKDLKAIVSLMRQSMQDADFLEDACSVLVALSPSHDLVTYQRMLETEDKVALDKLTEDCKEMVEFGVVDVLLDAAKTHPSDPDIQELMCRTLFHLGRTDAETVNKALAKSVDQIVKAMKSHQQHVGVQLCACGALRNIAVGGENKGMVARSGGVDAALGALMLHRAHVGVQEQALGALRNMAGTNDNKFKISQHLGVEATLGAMKEHDKVEGIQENGVVTLYSLALAPTLRDSLRSCGAAEVIAVAVRSFAKVNTKIKERGNDLLEMLTED